MKNKKGKNNRGSKTFPIIPILLVAAIWWAVSSLTNLSDVNSNKRIDATYENKLIKSNYAYLDDIAYKKTITSSFREYTLPDLEFVMGPKELENYLIKYNNDYSKYAYSSYNPGRDYHLSKKEIRANLNIHSSLTTGHASIKQILDEAATYADAIQEFYPGEKYILAITDINTMEECKEIIDTVKASPETYKNIKVVFGLEIPTTLKPNKSIRDYTDINILALCINPFDKHLLKAFPPLGMINTYDTIENDYDHTVDVLNKQNYLIYGIAKPLQNLSGSAKENLKLVDNILAYYVKNNPKEIKFVETYYSPYVYRHTTEAKALIETADTFKLYKIGSLELHGDSIFNVY